MTQVSVKVKVIDISVWSIMSNTADSGVVNQQQAVASINWGWKPWHKLKTGGSFFCKIMNLFTYHILYCYSVIISVIVKRLKIGHSCNFYNANRKPYPSFRTV